MREANWTKTGIMTTTTGVFDTMAEEITTPGPGQIRALVTVAGNPVLSTPNSEQLADALDALDFMVSIDLYLNETTRHADIILPSTIWLEELGCKATGGHIHLSDTALPPTGEARPLYRMIPELAERAGVADVYPWDSHEEAINAVINKSRAYLTKCLDQVS